MIFSIKNLSTFAFFLLVSSGIFIAERSIAQTPITPAIWSGSPASAAGPSGFTTLPATTLPGAATVNVSQWNRGAVVVNAAGGCYNSNSWQVGGSLALAQANNRCVFFTVTNSATVQLQITRLFIRSQVSATGPQFVQVTHTIGSVTNNFGGTLATEHDAAPEDFPLSDNVCVGPGETITFRLYGWGATGSAGTLRINDGTMIVAGFTDPVTATASSTSPVCAGTTLSFSSTASGGIPGYTYSWAGPDGFSSTLPNPSILSPLTTASGVYTLTVTDALSCTTSSVPVTTTVTVNSAPAAITGTTLVCPGLTTTLSSATVGGTWSSSNVAVATVAAATGVVTGVASGTATITYMLGSLCVTTTTVTVDIPPAPITGSMSLCQGTTTTLSSLTGGGTWSSSNVAVATIAASGVVTGITAGTANITYTIASGCIATTTVTVYPFPAPITGTASVCAGTTTTLSNTSAGGTWSSGNILIATVTAASGIVSGITAGTAVISYMLGGGCFSTIVVTVNPLPDDIGGFPEVCVGAVRSLVNATFGGTWSSSTPAVATVGLASGNVLGVSAGTVTITYTIATGCIKTITMTVNPIPVPITGPTGVCLGATTTLINTTTGGEWNSSNTTVATIGLLSGVLSGNAVGTSVISYTLTATGCFVTRVQTVNPLPTPIAGPATVCPGLTITLTSSPAGGTWVSDDVTLATVGAASGIVTGVTAGTVVITYTLPTTCRATRITTVHPAPPATINPLGDTVFCPGDFVVLTANTGTGLTYQWLQAAITIPGATTATYIASLTGNYRVRVTNTLGCPWVSAPVAVLVNSVSATITVPGGTTTDCAASPVVLNATAGPGLSYQWLLGGIAIPAATGNSYTATTSGDYTVMIINSTGCSDVSSPVTVTILPSPSTALTSSGPLTFCNGNNVVLTAETAAGYTYQWYNTLVPIAGATNSTYTASASGSYYAEITNSFGCSVNSIISNVTVNPLPSVAISLSGPKVFCTGGSVTLGSITGAGFSYQWYKGGVAIPGATGSAFVALTSGGYRVRVTNTLTGCADMTHADTVVTQVSSPVVLPLTPSTFCWGGSALLATNISPVGFSVNYQWFLNGVAIPGATASTYSADATGSYSCRITVPGSCVTTTEGKTVTELPLPDPIVVKSGSTLRTHPFYTSYQWYKNLVAIPGASAYSTVLTGSGNYKVVVTDTNNCQSVSATYVQSGSGITTGIGETELTTIKVYPNPVKGIVYIDGAKEMTVIVSGIDGRILLKKENATTIDLTEFASGVYILSLYDSDNILLKVEKLLKY